MSERLGDHLAREPFTLVMSSGFFGFFVHAGMLDALERSGLSPAGFGGSSAGALVGGLAAAGVPTSTLVEELLGMRREDFWDPAPGPGFLRGERFRRKLGSMLPVTRIEDCPRLFRVSTFDVGRRATHVVDRGPLVPAIYASCAVPGLFHAIRHDSRWLVDGGVRDRAGLAGFPAGTRILHHHLASRSPWRRPGDPAMTPPRRPGLVALVLEGLPRSGPFRLDAGRLALDRAREATARALDLPVEGGLVSLDTSLGEPRGARGSS